MRAAWMLGMALCLVAPTQAASEGRWIGQWASPPTGETDTAGEEEPPAEDAPPDFDVTPLFATEPAGFLVDAANLLAPQSARDRLDFLAHHAADSKIDLFVFVVDPAWAIPDELAIGDWISGKQAIVVLFPHGEPQRAGLHIPGPLAARISEAEHRRALQSSVMPAIDKEAPDAQLEAFLTQLSIRLYWMEEMLAENDPPAAVRPAPAPAPSLSEDAPADDTLAVPESWIPWMVVAAIVLVATPAAWWAHRMRARYRFPEFDVEPRLGGRHAAGVGAVISYLGPNLPPADQRDQMPDNPHRQ